MELLLEKLGLDVRLFLAQAVNFGIVFLVIYFLVYKKLLAFMNARANTIAKGVADAQRAREALTNIEQTKEAILTRAQDEALTVASAITAKAQEKKKQVIEKAKRQEAEILQAAAAEALALAHAQHAKAQQEIITLTKRVLTDVIEVNPASVDMALIRKAARAVRTH